MLAPEHQSEPRPPAAPHTLNPSRGQRCGQVVGRCGQVMADVGRSWAVAEVTWRCSVKIGKGVSSADGSENEKNAGKFDCHAACNMQHATRGTQHTQHCTHCRMRAGPQAVHASTVCAATSSPHTTVRKILISVHDWNERAKDAKNSSVHASRVCAATFAPHSPPPARPVSTRLRTQVMYGVVPHVSESRYAHCTVCTYGCRDVTLSVPQNELQRGVLCCNVLCYAATCCTVLQRVVLCCNVL